MLRNGSWTQADPRPFPQADGGVCDPWKSTVHLSTATASLGAQETSGVGSYVRDNLVRRPGKTAGGQEVPITPPLVPINK